MTAYPTGPPPGAHPTDPPPGAHPTDQVLLRAYDGLVLSSHAAAEIAAGEVPGVTLYRHHNVDTAAQVRALTGAMQAARPAGTPPLLIAIDQEGGQLLGLGEDSTPFAGNHALGAVGDPELAERVGAAIGRECAACGVNVLFAPVCDLLTEPNSPGFGIRSFGDDPERAGPLAAAFVRGVQSVGVAATLKHFPGAGAIAVDTHHDLAAVDAARALLDARELAVFRTALAAQPDLVMSGHFAVPALTGRADLPATLAGEVMRDLLRGELGFEGVTITDALDMKALSQGMGQVVDALAALQAGVDLLLCGLDEPANARLRDGLRLAWQRRLPDADALAGSVRRIDGLRRRLTAVEPRPLDVVGGAEHRELADELARRSITLVRDDAGLLPLDVRDGATVLVVEPRPRDLTPADTTSFVHASLAVALGERLPGVRSLVVDDPSDRWAAAAVVEAARRADLVVLGTSAASLEPAQADLARAVAAAGSPVVGVALRTVADLAVLADVPTVLCAYGVHRPTIEALVDVLLGERGATGRLPVTVPAGAGHVEPAARPGR
ncbi:MAG TPA: glycoside hydrolase family 3 protein [Egicoccus sp.]|nr:glycoside hydrolase family 3 protein [Egicoccus sp.]HSK23728.1 glycoside hydrolase family 3 protein [Egicoccus sp.]